MLVTSMFYTRIEIAERIGWTLQCNGFAQIISGFISFGVVHIDENAKPRQWQVRRGYVNANYALMLTNKSFAVAYDHLVDLDACYWQCLLGVLPGQPYERAVPFSGGEGALKSRDKSSGSSCSHHGIQILVVKRVSANQNGIETKKWKKNQFREALKDSKYHLATDSFMDGRL